MDNTSMITYSLGQISFPNYEEVIQWAKEVAETLNNTELREDNVKDVKASLAAARKVVDGINARRIEVKKALLTPYDTLEAQVKVITNIINEADGVLRDKVRAMEEAERDAKRETLKGIWDLRIPLYTFTDYIPDPFDRWVTPQHLNKTTSLKKCEDDMAAWMEQREQDISTIKRLPDATQILISYASCLDLTRAIQVGQEQAKREREVTTSNPAGLLVATFVITGEKDIQLAELLFKTNNIDYRRI